MSLTSIDPATLPSNPANLTPVGDDLFFSANDGTHGVELWRFDGTSEEVELVEDINQMPAAGASSSPSNLTAVGDDLFFSANDGTHGRELWRYDGVSGEAVLIKDINPSGATTHSNPTELTVIGSTLFFSANDGTDGIELWKSDGTPEGTESVKDINPGTGSNPSNLTPVGADLFFSANDGTDGIELWKSDGTPEGTESVKDINPGGNSGPNHLTALDGILYFSANDGTDGVELWRSDGEEAGTDLVEDINPGGHSSPANLTAIGDDLFFSANDGANGVELWRFDGEAEEVELVKNINPSGSAFISTPAEFSVLDGILLFRANDGTNGIELWKSDGTPVGTEMVEDINLGGAHSGPTDLTPVGDALFFSANDGTTGVELWRFDGATEEAGQVDDINPDGANSSPANLTALDGTLFFSADDGTDGVELWSSDGSAAGTATVADVNPAPQFAISELTAAGGLLYFAAEDKVSGGGAELWKSDGTPVGTEMVEDINPGFAGSNPRELTNVNGTLYFVANDGVHGFEVWRSNGTPDGTEIVRDINQEPTPATGSDPRELTNVNGTLFFNATNHPVGHNVELWRSNGTSGTTVMVEDINQTTAFASSNPVELSSADGTLFFTANDGTTGVELWKSDGTSGGTERVKDINPSGSSSPAWRDPAAGITRRLYSLPMYFRADNGADGVELWKTDGTEEGTELVEDINFGVTPSFPRGFLRFGGTTFFVADHPDHGVEPWGADESGDAELLKDINPGPTPSQPTAREVAGGIAYFTANDGVHGYELWRSDGTEGNTEMVTDLNPGSGWAFVASPPALPFNAELTNVNGVLYFSADDGGGGEELWETRGAEEDTLIAADVNPGPGTSAPRLLTEVNGTLYFVADDGSGGGRQLFALETEVPDADDDGIVDEIDTEPGTFSNEFNDNAAPTFGTILDRAGLDVTIANAAYTDGVLVTVGAGAGEVTLSVCDDFTAKVAAGTEALLTCGSLSVQVIEGEANVTAGDGSVAVSVPAQGVARLVENEVDGSVTVENSSDVPVMVSLPLADGLVTISVPPTGVAKMTESSEDGSVTVENSGEVSLTVTTDGEAEDLEPEEQETVQDSTAPAAPTLSATDPASPANENNPKVKGSAEPGSTVKLYTDSSCDDFATEGPAADFASPGISATVDDDTTTTFYATASDAAANTSPCSTSSVTYIEDSTPPSAPTLTATTPPSPSSNNTPSLTGSAEADSAVRVYSTADCTGSPLATGSAAQLASPGIALALPEDQTTVLRATATDAADNTSACSDPLAYTEDSTAPAAPTLSATDPASPANENNPKVKGSAEPGSTVKLYTDSSCDDFATEGPAADFASPGISATVDDDTTTTFYATATDAADNTSACSDPLAYTEDSTAPVTTIDSGPTDTISDSTPTFSFSSSEPDSSFECRVDAAAFAACTSPHTIATLPDGSHTFEVKATDQAGNAGSRATRSFTVDTTPPPQPPPPAPGEPEPLGPPAPKPPRLTFPTGGGSSKSVTVTPGGGFKLPATVVCAGGGPQCGVSTVVTAAGAGAAGVSARRGKAGKKRRVKLGGSSFKVRPGARAPVRASLNSKGKALLKKRGKIHANVAVTVTRGAVRTTKAVKVTLRAKKSKRRSRAR